MIKAQYIDKDLVVGILSNAFDTNKSVNYVVKQDKYRERRIKALMRYSFEMAFLYGDIFLSNDKKGCALLLYPDKKKLSFKSLWLDLQLAYSCIGLRQITKVLSRESAIKKLHPSRQYTHLWFLGVLQSEHHKGIGSNLLNEIKHFSETMQRPIYLETSTVRNLPWYTNKGFEIFNILKLDYELYLLKREATH